MNPWCNVLVLSDNTSAADMSSLVLSPMGWLLHICSVFYSKTKLIWSYLAYLSGICLILNRSSNLSWLGGIYKCLTCIGFCNRVWLCFFLLLLVDLFDIILRKTSWVKSFLYLPLLCSTERLWSSQSNKYNSGPNVGILFVSPVIPNVIEFAFDVNTFQLILIFC